LKRARPDRGWPSFSFLTAPARSRQELTRRKIATETGANLLLMVAIGTTRP
jgi:hypothetical protein